MKVESESPSPSRPRRRTAAARGRGPADVESAPRPDVVTGFDDGDGGGAGGFAEAAPSDVVAVDDRRRRGRGAVANPSGRYESEARVTVDDGWGSADDLPPFATTVTIEKPKTILTRNTSPDIGFDRSINPYRGCEHGCSYCFARPTHAYMGLSPGLDFESRLFAKPTAARLLEQELGRPGYQPKPIAIGTNTDPYQPVEKRWRIMREVLEVLERTGHPVTILTKSALVLRDLDILSAMAARGLVKVAISITTLDRKLARAMEPRAASPERRLAALAGLAAAGIPTGVMVAPVIPALTDPELERILEAAATAGVREAGYIVLRLPLEVSEIFKGWLLDHAPDRYRHVLSLLRSMRDGKDYDADWGKRMRGTGPYAAALKLRFDVAMKRLGLDRVQRSALRTDLFTPPTASGIQLSLF
ncbi:PA0069 family radical SAM protein [Siculibacillus lacustris]|uniref:PA0069 family radical SAM protein n=1 Tax=Siculibacillus lacustris TaxID=1549641 RepID=A0A4V6MYY0_9HYPH|nr:PA0069 family radical SAM protein [Siculibacillus lacustris]TBW32314.1 PA0069 family radical SAM protein [Siculibacillus lacustris]